VKELSALPNLSNLILWGTAVSDTGLKELAVLTNLANLNLGATRVTDTGVKELRKALPGCTLVR
jgi:hypothetical protein